MVSNINYYLYSLPELWDQNNLNLAASLQKLESGKNFQNPSEDVTDYFRSQDLNMQYDDYTSVKSNLTEWQGVLNTASTAAGEIYNDLSTMQELSKAYPTADPATAAADTAKYNSLYQNIGSIMNSTEYGGTPLLTSQTPLASINLVPNSTDPTQSLSINLGQIMSASDYSNLAPGAGQNIGDMGAALGTAQTDAQGFIGNLSGYQTGIQSNLNITNATMQNLQSFSSTLTNVDQAQELTNYTQLEILQQAGAAMLSQANVDQRSVLLMYQFPINLI